MSERPTPITRSDEILCAVIDELVGLRQDLAGRGGALAATPVEIPEPTPVQPTPSLPVKKAVGKRPRTEVTGR